AVDPGDGAAAERALLAAGDVDLVGGRVAQLTRRAAVVLPGLADGAPDDVRLALGGLVDGAALEVLVLAALGGRLLRLQRRAQRPRLAARFLVLLVDVAGDGHLGAARGGDPGLVARVVHVVGGGRGGLAALGGGRLAGALLAGSGHGGQRAGGHGGDGAVVVVVVAATRGEQGGGGQRRHDSSRTSSVVHANPSRWTPCDAAISGAARNLAEIGNEPANQLTGAESMPNW